MTRMLVLSSTFRLHRKVSDWQTLNHVLKPSRSSMGGMWILASQLLQHRKTHERKMEQIWSSSIHHLCYKEIGKHLFKLREGETFYNRNAC